MKVLQPPPQDPTEYSFAVTDPNWVPFDNLVCFFEKMQADFPDLQFVCRVFFKVVTKPFLYSSLKSFILKKVNVVVIYYFLTTNL